MRLRVDRPYPPTLLTIVKWKGFFTTEKFYTLAGEGDPMAELELEQLFAGLCRRKPLQKSLNTLKEHPQRQVVIDFLIHKLTEFVFEVTTSDTWDSKQEWGVTHSCFLLGELKAAAAGEILINVLDLVKDDFDAVLYNAAALALEGFGQSALEPAYERYQRDEDHEERRSVWVWVLANLGVHDDRIRQALFDHMVIDPAEAVLLMGDYGDPALLPTVESYVINLAHYLNDCRIDPFARGARLEDEVVAAYIDDRESLVMLKEGIADDHPDFDAKVEALDRQLLKYADFSVYDDAPIMPLKPQKQLKIKRNDPCPCGSGKKYKYCCGAIGVT